MHYLHVGNVEPGQLVLSKWNTVWLLVTMCYVVLFGVMPTQLQCDQFIWPIYESMFLLIEISSRQCLNWEDFFWILISSICLCVLSRIPPVLPLERQNSRKIIRIIFSWNCLGLPIIMHLSTCVHLIGCLFASLPNTKYLPFALLHYYCRCFRPNGQCKEKKR